MENSILDDKFEEPLSDHYKMSVVFEAGTDCESDNSYDNTIDSSEYDFEELELFKMQKGMDVDDKLIHYKKIDKSMTFKDMAEATKMMNFYALANAKALKIEKSDTKRLRCKYESVGCPLVCLISKEGKGVGFKVKTLKPEHTCDDDVVLANPRATTSTLAQYLKKKVQNNPKYKAKDMKVDLKNEFNLNSNNMKLKRAKRMALQKMHGSFFDEYNRLEAYANEIRESNPDSDVVINISKDALAEGRRKFLRMYIWFNALDGLERRFETLNWIRWNIFKRAMQG